MNNVYDDKKLQKAFDDGYAQAREDGKTQIADIEFYYSEQNTLLKKENSELRDQLESIETEFVRLRAQMDIVYLIFGGK